MPTYEKYARFVQDTSGFKVSTVTVYVYVPGTTNPIPLFDTAGGVTFTGAGLDDLTRGTVFTGDDKTDFCIQIDGEGTPDTFKWSKDGGSTWEATGVAITGAAQTLADGLTVTFAATTGHTSGDHWDFRARSNPFVTDDQGLISFFVDTRLYPRGTILLEKDDYDPSDLNAALEYTPFVGGRGPTGPASTVPGPTGPTGPTGGGGDVVGPSGAIDGNFAVFDGVTGKLLKDGASKPADYALLSGRAGGQVLIGSTSTDSGATIRATSGVGAAGSDIIFQVGNNGATEALRVTDTANVGIGTNAPGTTVRMKVASGYQTITSGTFQALWIDGVLAPTAESSATLRGIYGYTKSQAGNGYGLTGSLKGLEFGVVHNDTTTLASAFCCHVLVNNATTGTITVAYGLYSEIRNAAGGTIGTSYGVYVKAPTNPATATIGTLYGIYVESQTSVGTHTNAPYALYCAGASDKVYFAGNVGIGTTTPGAKLDLVTAGGAEIVLRGTGTGSVPQLTFYENTSTAGGYFQYRGSTATIPKTFRIGTYISGGQTQLMYGAGAIGLTLDSSGNVLLGTLAAMGTSAAKAIGMAVGTAPSTSPASAAQVWVADVGGVADKAGLHIKSEETGILGIRSMLGTMNLFTYQADALADDGTVSLPDATSGICIVSCNAEAGIFLVQTSGAVKLISTTTGNVATADTDTDLCCYDGGTGAIVKNRLGTTGEIRIIYYYN